MVKKALRIAWEEFRDFWTMVFAPREMTEAINECESVEDLNRRVKKIWTGK